MLLSTAYFPPVSWFALAARGNLIAPPAIEAFESYRKQTWRNRCLIAGPSSVEMLQVPVIHDTERLISAVRIDWSTPWLVRTERCLDTCYRSAPFYDHYRDSIFGILESRPEKLFDLNLMLIRYLTEKTGLNIDFAVTGSWEKDVPDDFRDVLSPKKPDTVLRDLGLDKEYYQVFSPKLGFRPGLSILDLLFNEGPESYLFLTQPTDL